MSNEDTETKYLVRSNEDYVGVAFEDINNAHVFAKALFTIGRENPFFIIGNLNIPDYFTDALKTGYANLPSAYSMRILEVIYMSLTNKSKVSFSDQKYAENKLSDIDIEAVKLSEEFSLDPIDYVEAVLAICLGSESNDEST